MNIKCFMLLAFCIAGAARADSLPIQNLTNATQPHLQPPHLYQTQRQLLRAPPSPPSSRTAPAKTIPTASKRVEEYAAKLRADMEAQERVLNAFIVTIKTKHQNTQLKLARVKNILKGLKAEIANATKYANEFQAEDIDQSKQAQLIQDEFVKSTKMFREEQANIEFEKKFLEEIIKYIQLKKANCTK
jgi:hypothetical protein